MEDVEMDDDAPEFVSPPFPVIFLTVAKVIISSLIVLGILGIIALIVVVLIGAVTVL